MLWSAGALALVCYRRPGSLRIIGLRISRSCSGGCDDEVSILISGIIVIDAYNSEEYH